MKALLLLPCLLVGFSCTSRVGPRTGSPAEPVHVTSFSLRKDVIYTPPGWPQALPADVYVPDGPGPWPGVLLIHGGSWANKDRRSDMEGIAEHLAHRGYVVMNATYRLAPQSIYPAQLQDLQQASRWFRAQAPALHLQTGHIGVFGYSAGAQLAGLLGAMDAPPGQRFQAVVAGGTPADLRKFPKSPIVATYLGGSIAQKPGLFAAASPVTHLTPGDPPVFIYHGSRDILVPPDQATDYAAALEKAHVPHELVWQKGRGHVTAFLSYGDVLPAALSFLDRHLRATPGSP